MENYTQYQQDYEKSCALLGRSTELPDVTGKSEVKARREIAEHILETITDAKNMEANDGKEWVPDMADTSEDKWHPVFDVIPDSTAPRGFRLAFGGCFYDGGYAALGARLACINSDVAEEMGEKYPDLYKDVRC